MNMDKAEYISVEKLHPFEGHPFKVQDDEEMQSLMWSIFTEGILTPLVVRPLENGEYEVISGHRRLYACKKAGIQKVPALIRDMDRDTAAIAVVDSNLHREHILPSEKAFAYKMKMEAISRQGKRTDLTLLQNTTKLDSAASIGAAQGDSRDKVFRYIRLTKLIPEILQKVDEKRIALTPAVEISYLTEDEQRDLLETMESEDCTPSLSQAQSLKKLSQSGELSMDRTFEIMSQQKANQTEKIKLDYETLRRYFPRNYSPRDMQQAIMQLVEQDYRRRQRIKDRGER